MTGTQTPVKVKVSERDLCDRIVSVLTVREAVARGIRQSCYPQGHALAHRVGWR